MTRTRLCSGLALFATLVIGIACTKKSSTEPGGGDDKPSPSSSGGETDRAAKAEAQMCLKQIGLAMHNYEDAMGGQPLGIVTRDGHLGLSWRVAILPYLTADEDAALYHQFNLKEPWDSEHNKKFIAKMPKVYESPGKKRRREDQSPLVRGEIAFMRIPPVNQVREDA